MDPRTPRRSFTCYTTRRCAVMTAHAGVVRDETGIRAGLAELTALDARIAQVSAHPDLAGFQDLAHAFDLKASLLGGCHDRADYPALDAALQVDVVWSGPGRLARETPPPIPDEIAALMRDVSVVGKLVE